MTTRRRTGLMLRASWVGVFGLCSFTVGILLPWLPWSTVNPRYADQNLGTLRPPMVLIPKGIFFMGSPKKETERDGGEERHQVVIERDFQLCQTEVTQKQWNTVMDKRQFDCGDDCEDDRPVHGVSWDDAVSFMNRLTALENDLGAEELTTCYERKDLSWEWSDPDCTGYRLPTEAEWEYAARADTITAYSHGDDKNGLKSHGWFQENAEHTNKVKTRDQNPWGLYDMHGNVWEWVWDRFKGSNARMLRGGSFLSHARDLRSARRYSLDPGSRERDVGVRCARSLPVTNR